MTQLNLKNATHKEGYILKPTKKMYLKIYTNETIFNVCEEEGIHAKNLFDYIKTHEFIDFTTNNDTTIYINTHTIVAIEISEYAFPERT